MFATSANLFLSFFSHSSRIQFPFITFEFIHSFIQFINFCAVLFKNVDFFFFFTTILIGLYIKLMILFSLSLSDFFLFLLFSHSFSPKTKLFHCFKWNIFDWWLLGLIHSLWWNELIHFDFRFRSTQVFPHIFFCFLCIK